MDDGCRPWNKFILSFFVLIYGTKVFGEVELKKCCYYCYHLNWAFFFSYPINSLLARAALLLVNRSTSPMHAHCSITCTEPGVCTIKYIPTLHGPCQLRITIRDTGISGGLFTVHVLQSPECRRQLRRSQSETLAYQVVPSQFMYYSLMNADANWGYHDQRH